MDPLNLGSSSSAPPPVANDVVEKRKRGRPRKEKSQVTPTTVTDDDLVGQTVYGKVVKSIDKGTVYLVNVKVKDSDTKLKGVVFLTGKDTPENDVAPLAIKENNQTGHPQHVLPPKDQPTTDDVTDLENSETARAKSLVIHQSKGVEEEEAAPSTLTNTYKRLLNNLNGITN